jgi:cytochrome c oxidase subunit 2
MAGLFGSRVELEGSRTVIADEQYLRRSIVDSTNEMVRGYKPIMPSFRGQVSEEQLTALIAYIKSVRQTAQPTTGPAGQAVPGDVEPAQRPRVAPEPPAPRSGGAGGPQS